MDGAWETIAKLADTGQRMIEEGQQALEDAQRYSLELAALEDRQCVDA